MSPGSGAVSSIYRFFPWFLRMCLIISTGFGVWDEFSDSIRSNLKSEKDVFDFIVVGSGSSGSVLANRLSEHFNVLLLEAGGRSSPVSSLPSLTFPLYWNIPEDWKYETVPQKHAGFALTNNVSHWSSGRGLGGSSLINGMIYIRGTVQGFDIISQQTQDPIWRLDNVLKYYKKIEDYHGYFDAREHGKSGRISVQKGHLSPYVKHLMRAGLELGYPVKDANPPGPLTEGFSPMELYIKYGLRWSAYNGYIQPIEHKRNSLTIRKYSYGYKVILDENNVAVGVEYLRHGKRRTARATKEVILSAGAIQSPKILMLSGIGPKNDLQALGIPVKIDLPVGQRLQDKFGAFVGPFTVDPGNSFRISRQFTLEGFQEYIARTTGPFTTSYAEAIYSVCSEAAKARGDPTPDIHAYILAVPMDQSLEKLLYTESFNFKPEFSKNYFSHAYGQDAVMKLVTLNKPTGFGTLKLKDANPTSNMLIDPNYLADRNDMDLLVEGIKFSVKVMEETSSMKEINAKLLPMPIPGCEHVKFRSDAYWECLGRHTTATAYKYCSTAPIGKDASDPIAVVDSRLRVLGAKGLRVIDGSVLQERYVSVNHVTCTMLGEIAADFILKEHLAGNRNANNHRRNF